MECVEWRTDEKGMLSTLKTAKNGCSSEKVDQGEKADEDKMENHRAGGAPSVLDYVDMLSEVSASEPTVVHELPRARLAKARLRLRRRLIEREHERQKFLRRTLQHQRARQGLEMVQKSMAVATEATSTEAASKEVLPTPIAKVVEQKKSEGKEKVADRRMGAQEYDDYYEYNFGDYPEEVELVQPGGVIDDKLDLEVKLEELRRKRKKLLAALDDIDEEQKQVGDYGSKVELQKQAKEGDMDPGDRQRDRRPLPRQQPRRRRPQRQKQQQKQAQEEQQQLDDRDYDYYDYGQRFQRPKVGYGGGHPTGYAGHHHHGAYGHYGQHNPYAETLYVNEPYEESPWDTIFGSMKEAIGAPDSYSTKSFLDEWAIDYDTFALALLLVGAVAGAFLYQAVVNNGRRRDLETGILVEKELSRLQTITRAVQKGKWQIQMLAMT